MSKKAKGGTTEDGSPEAYERAVNDSYRQAVGDYDPELDDPEDDATGYENDVDAEGDPGE